MVWNVIAAVASLMAAACALGAVAQTARLRREARQQILADALIAMISAAGTAPSSDPRIADAIDRVERAAGLSLLGLSAGLTESVLGLLDPPNHNDPQLLLMYATKAYDELRVENGGRPILAGQDDEQSLVTLAFKRLLLRGSDLLRRAAK